MFVKPTSSEASAILGKIGSIEHVTEISIAMRTQPVFTKLVVHGFVSFAWVPSKTSSVIISYRDELELGGGVYSLLIENNSQPREFFKFYVQVFEMLGTYFMQDGKIITVPEYRAGLEREDDYDIR